MIDKYGKKLFIFLGCDVVYFILWVIPAIKIPALAAVFTGLGLLTLTASASLRERMIRSDI